MVQQNTQENDFMRNMMEKACKAFDKKPSNRTFNLTGLSSTIMNRVGMKGIIPGDKLKQKLKDRKDVRILQGDVHFELLDTK